MYYLHHKNQSEQDTEANCPFLVNRRVLVAGPHHGSPTLKYFEYALLLDFIES